MKAQQRQSQTRRDFIKDTGKITLTSALAPGLIPNVYAAENNTIQVALVGCGSGAVIGSGS